MKTIILDKLPRIIKNKNHLEKALNIKISNRGKEVSINGNAEDEFIAEQVLDALNFGFPYSTALLINEEDFLFEIISIKSHTKKHDFSRIRARIIGTGGKTLSTLSTLTNCFFELKDNDVAIIGDPIHIKIAQDAIISLVKGTKTANVYAYLEKHQPKPILDLDLKK